MKVEVEFRVIKAGSVIVDVPADYDEAMLEAEAKKAWGDSDQYVSNEFEVASYTEVE